MALEQNLPNLETQPCLLRPPVTVKGPLHQGQRRDRRQIGHRVGQKTAIRTRPLIAIWPGRWRESELETHDGAAWERPSDLGEPGGREHGQRAREQSRSADAGRRQLVDVDGVTFNGSCTMITRV